jgi:hypothetical protein
MPREGQPLTDEQTAALTRWIRDGAAWPALKVPASLGRANEAYESLKREHWAWQPLTNPGLPSVSEPSWPKDDLDRRHRAIRGIDRPVTQHSLPARLEILQLRDRRGERRRAV